MALPPANHRALNLHSAQIVPPCRRAPPGRFLDDCPLFSVLTTGPALQSRHHVFFNRSNYLKLFKRLSRVLNMMIGSLNVSLYVSVYMCCEITETYI